MYAYLAFTDLHKNLEADLKTWDLKLDRLYLKKELVPTYWSQVTSEVEVIPIESIKKAAEKLKSMNSLWCPIPTCEYRRVELIQEQVTKIYEFEFQFLEPLKEKKWKFWSLVSKNQLLYSLDSTALPLNSIQFKEDKDSPPNRAYRKLWELFTVHGIRPKATSTALDLGASPGGWTWVLSQICKNVTSIDKALLDFKIQSRDNVRFIKGDAFNLDLKKVQPHDWLFCDVICYPDKILENIKLWMKIKLAENFVVTIKFKERPNKEIVYELESISQSKLIHLNHNKNELTWYLITNPEK